MLRRITPRLALPALAALPMVLAVPAVAQTAGEAPGDAAAQASEAFEMGMRLFQEQNWAGALAAFERAYSLQPHYAVLFNRGVCLRELHRYPEALDAFQRYLREGGDEIRPERRAEAERLIGELRSFLSRVTVAVSVDGADVRVDGHAHGVSPLAEPLVLGAGHHVIEARAAGHRDAREEFDIGGGEERVITLTLEPLEAAGPTAATTTTTTTTTEEWYEDWVGWTAAGAGLAMVGVGSYFLWDGSDKESQRDAALDLSVAHELDGDSRTSWVVGGVLAGVGAAALVTGVVLLALAPGGEEAPPAEGEAPAAAVVPLVGPHALGLAVVF